MSEFFGDWDKCTGLGNIPFADAISQSVGRCAHIARKQIIKNIRDQKIEGPDLLPQTRAKKRGSQKLIEKGDYLSSYTTKQISKTEAHVGTNHPQARALELGYEPRNLAARPHVGPAFEEAQEEMADEFTKRMIEVIEK
ncbi:MAG: phage morphogenesis protein [Spirochaetes bacterium]|nr:phage morphogenesis protein [Spirochaetota bacterium]MBN2771269.1 phage morphogenesis protein [Spirochaetota bacterium]